MTAYGLWTPNPILAPTSQERPAVPTSTHLMAPLLVVLGERSQYQPRQFSLVGRKHGMSICNEVLVLAGYDPEDASTLPIPLQGLAKPMGLYRRIQVGCRENSTSYSRPRPSHKGAPPFIVDRDKGWALTEAGVAAAATLRPEFIQDARNVTAIWLDGQITRADLYNKLLRGLMLAPKLAKERISGEIHDHLNTFLATSIRRNAFRSWLCRGDAPSVHQMTEWAVRKGISTFRHYSQDPLHRTMRGALTAYERKNGNTISTQAMVPTEYEVVLQGNPEDDNPMDHRVLVDKGATDRQLHDMAWKEGLDRVRDAIRRHKPGAPDRYVRVFNLMCQGYSVEEIGHLASTTAEQEAAFRAQGLNAAAIGAKAGGVSRNRAASIMADCRTAVRTAATASEDARTLLRWLIDEPFCTFQDIQDAANGDDSFDPLSITTNLKWLLPELLSHGRITEQRGSYSVSDKGKAFLHDWDTNPNRGFDFGQRVSL